MSGLYDPPHRKDATTALTQADGEGPKFGLRALNLPLTALAAGLVNLVGGGAILKSWIFNAGQTYYDALFRAFWLPEGVIKLPESAIFSAGYKVLLSNTEVWLIAVIYGIPAVIIGAFVSVGFNWLLARTIGQLSPSLYDRVRMAGGRLARIYLVVSLTLVLPWLIGMVWLGVYRYPRAAEAAGHARALALLKLTEDNCSVCPRWSDGTSGVAIASNGETALLATSSGVRSINVKAFSQNFPLQKASPTIKRMPSSTSNRQVR